LAARVRAVEQAYPDAVVEVWATDEHRVGLKPVLRRVWVPRGQRPVAVVHHRYEWLYLIAFVHPVTGANVWYILPRRRTDTFNLALAAFATTVGAGSTKQIVLGLDQAGWHARPEVVVPAGIHLVFLPPDCPELQPVERLWPVSNEPIANRSFVDLDALETVLAARGVTLMGQPEVVRQHTGFHWWPISKHEEALTRI
jgi:DDE superfamily endonuclease